jgi:hypothetical protein
MFPPLPSKEKARNMPTQISPGRRKKIGGFLSLIQDR